MSMYNKYSLTCPNSHNFEVKLARGVNAGRNPAVKEEILSGNFHKVSCPECKEKFTVEKPFSYTDLGRHLFIQVKPRSHFFNWKEASDKLAGKAKKIPVSLSPSSKRTVRVVFGLSELREKLLCFENDIDDKLIELAKIVLLYDHPFLLHRPRLRFTLTAIESGQLIFIASHVHDKRHYRISLPLSSLHEFAKKEKQLRKWLNNGSPGHNFLDKNPGHYIHFKRLMPHTTALSNLRKFAEAAAKNQKIDLRSDDFKNMLKQLPRGSHLTTAAKQDLKTLRNYALKNKLQQLDGELWEVYFGKEMDKTFWQNKNKTDIDTLWKLFEDLPDNHIEGNSLIHEIKLNSDNSGGTYDSETREIEIGNDPHQEDFEDTIRHEVGHGVYYEYQKKIQKWLEQRFGWKSFELSMNGLEQWMEELGGWNGIKAADKKAVFQCLKQAFDGKDDWAKGTVEKVDQQHPWNSKGLLAKTVYQKCPNDWYQHNEKWYRKQGKAFFLNYYYDTFCVVNTGTLELVNKMPDRYAAMSHEEFFAELYALYYDKDDPKRHVIPQDVMTWMKREL